MISLIEFNPKITAWLYKISGPLARIALFVVFFWFCALKLFDSSPANPLVASLLEKTLPFMTFEVFIVCLGIYEMVIGVLFLIPKLEQLAFLVWIPHIIMTTGPLLLLPEMAWSGFLVPTLEGQYIIKNLLIAALVVSLAAGVYKRPAVSASTL